MAPIYPVPLTSQLAKRNTFKFLNPKLFQCSRSCEPAALRVIALVASLWVYFGILYFLIEYGLKFEARRENKTQKMGLSCCKGCIRVPIPIRSIFVIIVPVLWCCLWTTDVSEPRNETSVPTPENNIAQDKVSPRSIGDQKVPRCQYREKLAPHPSDTTSPCPQATTPPPMPAHYIPDPNMTEFPFPSPSSTLSGTTVFAVSPLQNTISPLQTPSLVYSRHSPPNSRPSSFILSPPEVRRQYSSSSTESKKPLLVHSARSPPSPRNPN